MRKLVGGALVALFGVGGVCCSRDAEVEVPVVVTDESNRVVDMPVGVRWDVVMHGLIHGTLDRMVEWCDAAGGVTVIDSVRVTCQGVDF